MLFFSHMCELVSRSSAREVCVEGFAKFELFY